MRKRDLEAAVEALNQKYGAALVRNLELEEELATGEPCLELVTMLARAVHSTDLTGEQWRKDALALLKRRAAHTEESGRKGQR